MQKQRERESGDPASLFTHLEAALVVGNARSVRLAYGDRDIDLAPHTRVDVARLTLD